MQPYTALIDVGMLYGTTLAGVTHNDGAAFRVTPSGSEKVLHSFAGPPDGAAPLAALLYVGALKKFFRTTSEGNDGSVCIYSYGSGCGTVFPMDASGDVSVLYAFDGSPDGAGMRNRLQDRSVTRRTEANSLKSGLSTSW